MLESTPRLVLDALSYEAQGRVIVSPVSIELALRGRTVILGPNGAGKSTLLQLIHGMLSPSAGSVTVLESPGESRSSAVRSRPVRPGDFGFVLQRPVMLSRSVEGNVLHALAIRGVPARDREFIARRALQQVGLHELADRPARRLSGGEQQRLAIARATAASPICLLLDEPTAHLDPGASSAIERLIASLTDSGPGFVMSTHDLGQARRLADRVLFMHRGAVVECSAATTFFQRPSTESARRFLAGELLD